MLSINILVYTFLLLLLFTSFMVIYAQHPVFSLLFLISSFLLSSFLLFILECEFLALLFVIIYVGAIAILFLFSIMMLETKLNNLSKSTMKYLPIAFIFGFLFLIPLSYEFLTFFNSNLFLDQSFYQNTYVNWYDLIDSVTDIQVYGQVLYSYYVLQFLIAGLILLLVLLGIVYLTSNSKPDFNTQSSFKQLSRKSKFFFQK